jgi:hypothetical protein
LKGKSKDGGHKSKVEVVIVATWHQQKHFELAYSDFSLQVIAEIWIDLHLTNSRL